MNYRQWKKNYKKQHGHNPPIEADKKKRALAIKLVPSMIDALNDFAPQFFKALEEAARAAEVVLGEMADSFCEIAERWSNGGDID